MESSEGMSVSIATMGFFNPPIGTGTGTGETIFVGGGGGTQYIERERAKPRVNISRVRYDKYKEKKVEIISIEEL